MSFRNKNNFWAESCFKVVTCSFDDLPDCCRGGWHHGSLIQTQFTNIHDVEAIHVLLWSDGVTYCSLVDVLWGCEGPAQTLLINCYLQQWDLQQGSSWSGMFFRAATLTVFTRKWQLDQQAADPPVTVHLVNQLQQLLLGDRAWPHHCVTGNTCVAPQMMHVFNLCPTRGYTGMTEGESFTQDAGRSSFVLHIGTTSRVFPD